MNKTTMQGGHRNAFGKFDCPQPGCERVGERGFGGPQGRGSHLKRVHGIAGSSESTRRAKRAQERSKSEPNSWGRYDCPEKECGRKEQSGLPTPQALGRHLQAMHGQPGRGPNAERRRRRKGDLASLARVERRVQHDDETDRHKPTEIHVGVEALSLPSDHLHYCPGCGFDLDAAKQHLHPSVRTHAYIRCPQCRTNLAVVSAVLRPEIQSIQPEHAMTLFEAARRVSSVL